MNIRNQKVNIQSSQQGGVQSMRSTTLGEQMTRNTLDRQRALEAAELALLIGENEVVDFADEIVNVVFSNTPQALNDANFNANNPGDGCLASLDNVTGLCIPAKHRLDYGNGGNFYLDNWLDVDIWSDPDGNHRTVDPLESERVGVVTPPKYIIEFMGFIPDAGGTQCDDGFGTSTTPNWPFCPQDQRLFRITALATGGVKDNARVMLQSTFVVP